MLKKYLVEYLLDNFQDGEYKNALYYVYVHFMANYVVHTMGKKNLIYALKTNRSSTLFNHLTISDEAWTITMLVNNGEC